MREKKRIMYRRSLFVNGWELELFVPIRVPSNAPRKAKWAWTYFGWAEVGAWHLTVRIAGYVINVALRDPRYLDM